MKIDIHILLDKIYGRLDEQENILFESWLSSDEKHRAYFEKLKQRELKSDYNEIELSDEKQNKYRKLFLINLKLAGIRKKNQRRRMLYIFGAAALIILFASISLFTEENKRIDAFSTFTEVFYKKVPTAFAKAPKVSNKKVQLITARGEKISLLDVVSDESIKTQSFELSDDKMALTYSETNDVNNKGINTLLVERGAEFRITLSDGTLIHLNSDSKLYYPTVFIGNERRVSLQGEAYFEVARNEHKPFIVSVGSTEIRVLGTEFNVNSRKPEAITTTLVSGSVALKSPKMAEIQLKPGFTAIVDPTNGSLDINDNDVQRYIGWNTGNYLFENTSLSDILDELSIWYDMAVVYQTEQAAEEKFTGSLSRNLSIEKLIQLIERTNYLNLELKGKTLIVKDRKDSSVNS